MVNENPSNGELSENVDLQEAYNKFCKVAANDAMNVNLGLQKIAFLELDKKNLLLKLFDANELLDKVKIKNMLLLDKVKNSKLELSVPKEQTNRYASSKLEHMLGIQKFLLNKTGLGFEDSISVPKSHSTNSVASSEPSVSETVKLVEVTPLRKTSDDLKVSKFKNSTLPKDKLHDRPAWICHFCGKSRHIHPNCFKLQVAKRANKPKVHVPQAQDPMVLIGELIKALKLYFNPKVAHHSNMNNNFNVIVASKMFWMQKAQFN